MNVITGVAGASCGPGSGIALTFGRNCMVASWINRPGDRMDASLTRGAYQPTTCVIKAVNDPSFVSWNVQSPMRAEQAPSRG